METILRKFLNENQWRDIYDIIEELWINLVHEDFLDANWLYLNIFWENYIFVKKWLSKKMERFTLWHELCHFLLWESWFSINLDFHRKSVIEQRADDFSVSLFCWSDSNIINNYNDYENIPTLSNLYWIPEKFIEKKLNILFKNKI